MVRRGISILDLLDLPAAATTLIPADITTVLERLAIVELKSTTSDDALVYYGACQSIADLGLPGIRDWDIQAPGLNQLLEFQLTVTREAPEPGDDIEPGADTFNLDLFLDPVSVELPDVFRPARKVPTDGVTPAHLIETTDDEDGAADPNAASVYLVGSGVLRIMLGSGDDPAFIDHPDPFDPEEPVGPIATLGFSPPHFFIGSSTLGLTIDRITVDFSQTFTPPEIVARGQGDTWTGLALREAAVYAPRNVPVLGDLSIGVRNALFGVPMGLQGELFLDFGQSAGDPTLVSFFQEIDEADTLLGAPTLDGQGYIVDLSDAEAFPARVRASLPGGLEGDWEFPDGAEFSGTTTPYFLASPGDALKFRSVETGSEGEDVISPELTFRFRDLADEPQGPLITAEQSSVSWPNTTSVSGTSADLTGMTFTAVNHPDATGTLDTDALRWQLGTGAVPKTGSGDTFTLDALAIGTHELVLTDDRKHTRRVKIEVIEVGQLLVGAEGGAFDATGALVEVSAVEASHGLQTFHNEGLLLPAALKASVDSPPTTTVDVPDGTLAQVSLEIGVAGDPDGTPATATAEVKRHVQIEMAYNGDTEIGWGEQHPDETDVSGGFNEGDLQAWAAKFTGAQFVIIGRTDDIGSSTDNIALGRTRAEAGRTLLTGGVGPSTGDVFIRPEQETFDAGSTGESLEATIDATDLGHTPNTAVWLIQNVFSATEIDSWGDYPANDSERAPFRRVDIFAVGGTPAADAPTTSTEIQLLDAARRRLYIPSGDDPIDAIAPREPTLPYAVSLVVAWDSPTLVDWGDAVPTLFELTVAWQSEPLALPGGSGEEVTPKKDESASGPEIFTVIGRFTHDARLGDTIVSLSLDSTGDPDGLFVLVDGSGTGATLLAATLAVGPALIAIVSAADIDDNLVTLAALIAAGAAIAVFAENGKAVVHRLEVEYRDRSGSGDATSLLMTMDYSVEIGFQVTFGGVSFGTDTGPGSQPLRLRYSGVGFKIDNAKTGLDRFSLVFDDVSVEVENPGTWRIDGPLGEVLRVLGTRVGSGSTWVELDLGFALDLGVIELTGATIRLEFDGGDVKIALRGLAVKVDIAEVLTGEGRLTIGDGGAIKAGIEVQIIPAGIGGRASLAIQEDFVALEVGVNFSVGIPLANSGLGIFGFVGRFVANGSRDLSGTSATDPVQAEIDWYNKVPENKYGPDQGQWALGLGVLVGTLPDTAFTFNALGMFVIGFPSLSVILSIDAKFISAPGDEASETGSVPSSGFVLLGIIAIDPSALIIGIRGSYEVENVLELQVPISGYFPFASNPDDAYFRIGADGVNGRTGDPITITLLPGILDVRAWSYLMIEEKVLHKLGGDDRFNFDGFSIGFGTGFEINWAAGPIKLYASAYFLAGVGTKPLIVMAGVFISGKLDLVVISLSVTGEIILKLSEDESFLDGEFCAEVKLLFVKIKGCVSIRIGNSPSEDIPVPDSPLTNVELTDRRAIITGKTTSGTPTDEHTVWPDTVPVLHFEHYVETALTGSAFDPPYDIPGTIWSGTTELKYAFRLVSLEIINVSTGVAVPGPLDSCWWLPTHRPAFIGDTDDAQGDHEGRVLGLLFWDPAPWSRNLLDNNDDAPGHPTNTLETVCIEVSDAHAACALGRNLQRLALDRVVLLTDGPSPPPYPTNFELFGLEHLGDMSLETFALTAYSAGLTLTPGALTELPLPVNIPLIGELMTTGYQLPYARYLGVYAATLDVTLTYSTPVNEPDLVVEICFPDRPPPILAAEVCDEYSDLIIGRDLLDQFPHGDGLTYVNIDSTVPLVGTDDYPFGAPDGVNELRYGQAGLRVLTDRPASAVRAVIASDSSELIRMRVQRASGGPVNTEGVVDPTGIVELTITADDIVAVQLTGGGPFQYLIEICFEYPPWATQFPDLGTGTPLPKAVRGLQVPAALGLREGASDREAWRPVVLQDEMVENQRCLVLRFTPRNPGTWDSVKLESWPGTLIWVVSSCAVTWSTTLQIIETQQAQDDFVDAWNDVDFPSRKDLLEPDTEYIVRAELEYQGWRRTETSSAPPPTSSGTWISLGNQDFRFRTAAADPLIEPLPPADFIDETAFDPRSVARYLLGFEPDGTGFPHFLDDPVEVYFSIDHLEQLLELYERLLVLKVRRTDPPAGSLEGLSAPPDLALAVTLSAIDPAMLSRADSLMAEVAESSPCLNERPMGGSVASLDLELEPKAFYDLMLVAPPDSSPDDDDVLVARINFGTSRYANPSEMLDALGFQSGESYPIVPQDAFVDVDLPTDVIVGQDTGLDQALTDLGMDPWPLVETPRVVVLWRLLGPNYRLVGVLLETDEALERGERLAIASLTVGGTPLDKVRVNAAATRVLFADPAGILVGPSDRLELTLTEPSGTISGQRNLAGGPRVLNEEGV